MGVRLSALLVPILLFSWPERIAEWGTRKVLHVTSDVEQAGEDARFFELTENLTGDFDAGVLSDSAGDFGHAGALKESTDDCAVDTLRRLAPGKMCRVHWTPGAPCLLSRVNFRVIMALARGEYED